ncbi:MAG TPA: dihydroorotate dehydrogenase [Actinomycetota bacterium]
MAGVKRSLTVELGGLTVSTPVMVAAGCAGTGRELHGLVDLRKVGAVVSRTITALPRKGAPTPRISESPAGIVWETGLQNPGLDAFVVDELARLAGTGVPTIVSIGGGNLEDFVRLTSGLQGRSEVAAIEVHLSLQDDELARATLGAHPDRVGEIVGAVARLSLVPVFAKLPGGVGDVVELARAAARAGATGVTLLGSPPALAVDAAALRPELGHVTGWLSGPVLKPLTLRSVFEVARALPDVPVIASGGIRTGEDAVEAMLAGAWAVQTGTATLLDPTAPVRIAQGIVGYLRAKNLGSPADIRGRLRVPPAFGTSHEAVRP